MIKNEREYWKTVDQWHDACSMYWNKMLFKNPGDEIIYQRWSQRAHQLDERLRQYEKTQSRGWRGGRENSKYLAEVQEMIRQTAIREKEAEKAPRRKRNYHVERLSSNSAQTLSLLSSRSPNSSLLESEVSIN